MRRKRKSRSLDVYVGTSRVGSYTRAPNGAEFSDTPWNEWLCLHLCRAFGLPSAQAEVLHFDGKPVIIIERFDRLWQGGVLYRLPQEDLCQALGVPLYRDGRQSVHRVGRGLQNPRYAGQSGRHL